MEENQNRILLLVTLAAVLIGGITLWVQYDTKTRKPVIGWYNLGTETFDLKPSAYHTFSYRDLPAKFRVEAHANEPVAFGFVTPDTYGHFTSTIMQIDFATLPCGTAPATNVDLNCATQSDKRYLLLTDTREDSVPEPPSRKARLQKAAQVTPSTLPDNHVTVKMYDWRCLKYCENLPKS
jgi:hypothetical protein